MKTYILAVLFALCSLGAWGCPPPIPVIPDVTVPDAAPLPNQDASPAPIRDVAPQPAQDASETSDAIVVDVTLESASASPCARLCASLASLGCSMLGPACPATCEHVLDTRIIRGFTQKSVDCGIAAKSKAAINACPGLQCQ